MIRVVHPGSWIRMLTFYPSRIPDFGSRGQKRHRILDPDPQHWFLYCSDSLFSLLLLIDSFIHFTSKSAIAGGTSQVPAAGGSAQVATDCETAQITAADGSAQVAIAGDTAQVTAADGSEQVATEGLCKTM